MLFVSLKYVKKNFFNREMPTESERKIIEEEIYIREPERSSMNVHNTQREKYLQLYRKELRRARLKRENRMRKAEMEAKKKAIEENVEDEGDKDFEAEEETQEERVERENKEEEGQRIKRKRKLDGKFIFHLDVIYDFYHFFEIIEF